MRSELVDPPRHDSRGKHGISGYILALLIALGILVLLQEKNSGVRSVTSDEAAQLKSRDTSVVLLDVRTVDECNSPTGHLGNANLIPLQTLRNQLKSLNELLVD